MIPGTDLSYFVYDSYIRKSGFISSLSKRLQPCHLRPPGTKRKATSTGRRGITTHHTDAGAVSPTSVHVCRGHRATRRSIAELLLLLNKKKPGLRRNSRRSNNAELAGTGRSQDATSDAASQLFPRAEHVPESLAAWCWYAACWLAAGVVIQQSAV